MLIVTYLLSLILAGRQPGGHLPATRHSPSSAARGYRLSLPGSTLRIWCRRGFLISLANHVLNAFAQTVVDAADEHAEQGGDNHYHDR